MSALQSMVQEASSGAGMSCGTGDSPTASIFRASTAPDSLPQRARSAASASAERFAKDVAASELTELLHKPLALMTLHHALLRALKGSLAVR